MIYENVFQKKEFQILEAAKLIENFLLAGGKVQKAKVGRKIVKTFPKVGGVGYKGAKAVNLKDKGLYVR